MHDLLCLKAIVFVEHFVKGKLGRAELDSCRGCLVRSAPWDVIDIDQDHVFLQELDVEVVNGVLEGEEGVIDGLDTHRYVGALCVVIEEIDCEESLDRARLNLVLSCCKQLR